IDKEVFENSLSTTEEDKQFGIEIEHEILKLNKNNYKYHIRAHFHNWGKGLYYYVMND
ncbi:25206_t:CDS:2, partial [Cetraspora pellucida]